MFPDAKFLTDLEVTPLPDGRNWRVVRDLKFVDQMGNVHVVHAGFVTDFASIPSLSKIGAGLMLIGAALFQVSAFCFPLFALGFLIAWIADDLNCDDALDGPATIHDEGYRRPRLGSTSWTMKFYWDWIFFVAMRVKGVELWKCWLIWFNVAAFGWWAWYDDGRKQGGNQ